jgi:hypothetical protein
MLNLPRSLAVALVLSFASCPSSAGTPSEQTPAYEQSLRARVQQYYGYMQQGKYTEAATLVTKATRDNFQNTHKGPFLSFNLDTIRFDPPGSPSPKKAEVTVMLETFPFGSVSTLHSPETTNWVRLGEIWSLEAPPPHVATFEELTKGGHPGQRQAPPDELKFTSVKSDLGKLKPGDIGVALFPFKNVSDHPVSLEVTTYCDCLVVKNLKKKYQPGETGELRLDFNSTNYLDEYAQTIFVKTSPGGVVTRLWITGYVVRLAPEKPEPPRP